LSPLWGLRATYDDHLRLIGKRVVLIELYWLGVTAEALRAKSKFSSKSAILLQRGPVYPKFEVDGVASTNHSSCHKTRANGLSCGIRMRAQLSFVLSQCTRLTDRQTDGRTDRQNSHHYSPRLHSTQRGKKLNSRPIHFSLGKDNVKIPPVAVNVVSIEACAAIFTPAFLIVPLIHVSQFQSSRHSRQRGKRHIWYAKAKKCAVLLGTCGL